MMLRKERWFHLLVWAGALALLVAYGAPGYASVTWSNDGTTSGWSTYYGTGTHVEVSSPTNTGSTALKFQISSNQQDAGGRYHNEYHKADIATADGSDIWIGWATYIPSVSETPDVDGTIIAQFFDKRVNNKPINIFILDDGHVTTNIYSDKSNYRDFTTYDLGTYTRGEWNYFVVNVKFSNGSGAVTKVWKNGVLEADTGIANAFSDTDEVQFQIGAYVVDPDWNLSLSPVETRIMYQDTIKLGTSYADVDPEPSSGTAYQPSADSFVYGGDTGANYGSSTIVAVKNATGTAYDRFSYLKFDLSAEGSSVNSATLRIYCDSSSGNFNVSAYEVATDSWTESGITYTNKPALGSLIDSVGVSSSGTYYDLDVTSYVNSELSGDQEVSLALFDGGQADQIATFDSKEGANPPELILQ